ncbi:ABC transporter permease [Metasolibacillus sp.]|uniref:ABC transporter permease n=1 Tax=Metasolibacillus sp. TaxID=2703680 RepID=UPI0026013991|nr:ABC transporter permease [Metasolibacillus sp.]MCT6922574.1 ABC transporter permease [Metasolibacillus sp.]MCT6939087.1 ABC transporter permease [Metasolibacillus sp.]
MKFISNVKLLLKITQEYVNAQFTIAFSAIFSVLLLLYSFNFSEGVWRPYVLYGFLIYAVTTLYVWLTSLLIKRDLAKVHQIERRTRWLGYPLMLTIFAGNIFAAGYGFMLVTKNKTAEYTFAVYALMTQIVIFMLSALNIFKPYVVDSFVMAMAAFIALALVYAVTAVLVARYVTATSAPKWMQLLGIVLLLATVTGNLFATLLGFTLIRKARNADPSAIEKWQKTWDKILRNTMAVFGMFFIITMFSLSIVSSWTFDYDFATQNNYSALLQGPSFEYPLGTDDFGRDLFSRIVFGAQISLIVGFFSTIIPAIIGGALGAFSGYYGRHTDNIIMRLLDILYAIPGILLAIAIIAAFGANTVNLIIALSVGAIPTYARTMRANVMQIANYEFVESARALGVSDGAIIFKHIVPNSLAPMIVKATLTIGGAVISTSSLSFLGLGVEPHIPEWGNILKVGSTYLETHSYVAIFPGICIMLLVLSFNFFGDGLRDALDPKSN